MILYNRTGGILISSFCQARYSWKKFLYPCWFPDEELLDYVGVDSRRFNMSWVSASEGAKWKDVVEEVVENAKEAGPFEQFRRNKINW